MNKEQRIFEIAPSLSSDGAKIQGTKVRGLFLITGQIKHFTHVYLLYASYVKRLTSLVIKKK